MGEVAVDAPTPPTPNTTPVPTPAPTPAPTATPTSKRSALPAPLHSLSAVSSRFLGTPFFFLFLSASQLTGRPFTVRRSLFAWPLSSVASAIFLHVSLYYILDTAAKTTLQLENSFPLLFLSVNILS